MEWYVIKNGSYKNHFLIPVFLNIKKKLLFFFLRYQIADSQNAFIYICVEANEDCNKNGTLNNTSSHILACC